MADLTVSVVIVSRDRPRALRRCLTGVSQLQYPAFEIVVVADPAGLAALDDLPGVAQVKRVAFDEANISAARNLGVGQAAGEMIAFIDDDAVPEPTWLRYLVAPAARREVSVVGGFVRGRNGIGFQHRARILDAQGYSHDIDVDPVRATLMTAPPGRAVKTEGTNMAVRRDALVDLGGFDTAFHYYLDETDVNMRLAAAGHATAIAPLAQVHHGFAASAVRGADRVPRDLFQIGASWAVFQRKHLPPRDRARQWSDILASERRRLLTHMVAGRLEPAGVRRLMRGLRAGYDAGQARHIGDAALSRHSAQPFRAFSAPRRTSRFTAVRGLRGTAAIADAAQRVVRDNTIETVLVLSRTALFHRVEMTAEGVWVQRGGQFGRSDRDGRLVQPVSFARRTAREKERVAVVRGLAT